MPHAQRGILFRKTSDEEGLVSFWLQHGRFTQNMTFARDLCIAVGIAPEKKPKGGTSTESYLILGRIEKT